MLARVHIEEKIGQGTFQSRSPALVNRKTRSGNFRSRLQIENPGALTHFPMRLRGKIERRRSPPSAYLHIFRGTVSYRDTEVRYIGNGKQQAALS